MTVIAEGPAPEPQLMPWPAAHYGCRVVELGEESTDWAVAGPSRGEHVDDRRAVAAVLHHLRTDCALSRDDGRDVLCEIRKVERRWVTVVDNDDEPWQWADEGTPGAWAVTYVETY